MPDRTEARPPLRLLSKCKFCVSPETRVGRRGSKKGGKLCGRPLRAVSLDSILDFYWIPRFDLWWYFPKGFNFWRVRWCVRSEKRNVSSKKIDNQEGLGCGVYSEINNIFLCGAKLQVFSNNLSWQLISVALTTPGRKQIDILRLPRINDKLIRQSTVKLGLMRCQFPCNRKILTLYI